MHAAETWTRPFPVTRRRSCFNEAAACTPRKQPALNSLVLRAVLQKIRAVAIASRPTPPRCRHCPDSIVKDCCLFRYFSRFERVPAIASRRATRTHPAASSAASSQYHLYHSRSAFGPDKCLADARHRELAAVGWADADVCIGAEVGPRQKVPDILDRVMLIRSP